MVRRGPALLKFAEEQWVGEGPSVHNALHQVDQHHHQAGDQEEGNEGTEMRPHNTHTIAETSVVTVVRGLTGCR